MRKVIVADKGGQGVPWAKVLVERFAQFDYAYDLAVRWYPAGRHSALNCRRSAHFVRRTIGTRHINYGAEGPVLCR